MWVRFREDCRDTQQYGAIDKQINEGIMEIKPIRTEVDYQAALLQVESLMTAKFGTPDGERLNALATLVESYEAKHFRLVSTDSVEKIKFPIDRHESP
jgi:antitoxin component HigA of HigAB toxin-antitoxin module